MNDAVHIGGDCCACRPIACARSFSRATLACVAASSGREKVLSTDNGCATGGGIFGKVTRAWRVSTFPDARLISAFATTAFSASTGTPPIACQAPAPAGRKWSGSPAIVPRIDTIESLLGEGAVSVSRTIAPGSGRMGEIEKCDDCAGSVRERVTHSASMLAEQIFI
jgi:hypothetical protein